MIFLRVTGLRGQPEQPLEAGIERDLDVPELLRLRPGQFDPGAAFGHLRRPDVLRLLRQVAHGAVEDVLGLGALLLVRCRDLGFARHVRWVGVARADESSGRRAGASAASSASRALSCASWRGVSAGAGAQRRRRARRLAHDGAGGHHARGGEGHVGGAECCARPSSGCGCSGCRASAAECCKAAAGRFAWPAFPPSGRSRWADDRPCGQPPMQTASSNRTASPVEVALRSGCGRPRCAGCSRLPGIMPTQSMPQFALLGFVAGVLDVIPHAHDDAPAARSGCARCRGWCRAGRPIRSTSSRIPRT